MSRNAARLFTRDLDCYFRWLSNADATEGESWVQRIRAGFVAECHLDLFSSLPA